MSTPELGERIISVVELPDGRYAIRNERDLSALTKGEEDKIADALLLWFDVRSKTRVARERIHAAAENNEAPTIEIEGMPDAEDNGE